MSLLEDGGLSEYLNDDQYEDEDVLPDGSEENPFGPDEENFATESAKASTSGVKVEPKKRSVRNPKPRLTIQLLRGEKGIHIIEDYFKGFKVRGKGYEREDLDNIIDRLQSWGACLYPLDTFDSLLDTIERLNKKRDLQTHMARYRAGLLESMKLTEHNAANQQDDGPNGIYGSENANEEPFDEIDALLDQQIAISMMTENNSHQANSSALSNRFDKLNSSPPNTSFKQKANKPNDINSDNVGVSLSENPIQNRKPLTSEQMARIAENRRLALERLAAKKKASQK